MTDTTKRVMSVDEWLLINESDEFDTDAELRERKRRIELLREHHHEVYSTETIHTVIASDRDLDL